MTTSDLIDEIIEAIDFVNDEVDHEHIKNLLYDYKQEAYEDGYNDAQVEHAMGLWEDERY